nr:MAG TPA: hypothetical protein [Caudoviricetes sp.]DAL69240.1 MAG TPA: hypothetical protein [Caudoviricetes sp.]
MIEISQKYFSPLYPASLMTGFFVVPKTRKD